MPEFPAHTHTEGEGCEICARLEPHRHHILPMADTRMTYGMFPICSRCLDDLAALVKARRAQGAAGEDGLAFLKARSKLRDLLSREFDDDCPLDHIDDVLSNLCFTIGDLRALLRRIE